MAKYSVFITYGVYVDAERPLTDEEVAELAVAKLQEASTPDLMGADFEIEDVTKEFEEN